MRVFVRGGKWGCSNSNRLRTPQEGVTATQQVHVRLERSSARVLEEDSWPPEMCS